MSKQTCYEIHYYSGGDYDLPYAISDDVYDSVKEAEYSARLWAAALNDACIKEECVARVIKVEKTPISHFELQVTRKVIASKL